MADISNQSHALDGHIEDNLLGSILIYSLREPKNDDSFAAVVVYFEGLYGVFLE